MGFPDLVSRFAKRKPIQTPYFDEKTWNRYSENIIILLYNPLDEDGVIVRKAI